MKYSVGMANLMRIAETLLIVLMITWREIAGDCVSDKTAEVKVCFDQLKTDMMTEAPSDVNDFLCSDPHKDRLECVIDHFNACPAFKNEKFINDLKHTASNFHAMDLFHVSSADEFCKCAPTHMCMEKVETDKLYMEVDDGPWSKMANQEYICGLARNHIDCVAKSLPTCDDYLQYKHLGEVKVSNKSHDVYNVTTLEYASIYADKHCRNWPDEEKTTNCSTTRAAWKSVEICYRQANHLRERTDKSCALRICIERAMFTCPKGEMDYFIDAVNVFSDTKIDTVTCDSSACSVTAMFSAILMLALCMLLHTSSHD